MSKKLGVILGAAVILIVIVALGLNLFNDDNGESVILASGTIEAAEADLGFQIPGRIESIYVREGDVVDSAAVLASLDRAELLARLEAARAGVAAAQAGLREVQTGFRSEEIAQGRAAYRAANDQLANARIDLERTRRLHDGGAVSRQALDHQETAFAMAEAEQESAAERLRILETGPRSEHIAIQQAQLLGAEAQVRQIEAALENAIVRSPFPGTISVRHREPGEIVQPGFPVISVLNTADRWVRIYVREDEVGRIAIGREAVITADAYPDRSYTGVVIFLSDEAEFTPRNVQTTEERVKLVYRVKVQITRDPTFDLKPGLAADVRIETAGQ